MTKNLCIFPYGLKFSHITRATLDVFGKCGIVYPPVFDALTAQFPELGRKLELIKPGGQKETEKTGLSGFKSRSTAGTASFRCIAPRLSTPGSQTKI